MIGSMPHRIPDVGSHATHFWETHIGTLPDVGDSPRQVVAANLDRLMRESVRLRTLELLSKDCGISRGTLDRIRRAVVSTGVDQLEAIGRSFGLQPFELLTPNAQAHPPNVVPLPPRSHGPRRSMTNPARKAGETKPLPPKKGPL